jgi:hypothetical protein
MTDGFPAAMQQVSLIAIPEQQFAAAPLSDAPPGAH